MSILKNHATDHIGPPYDHRGRFVSRQCPVEGCDGSLRWAGSQWECDGLVDPNDERKELQTCGFFHRNGEEFNPCKID